MFPLRDDNPSPRFPILVVLLIFANVFAFWLEFSAGPEHIEAFIHHYGLVPERDYSSHLRLIQFFSSMFLHGGFMHLIMNMWSFWIFGDNVEGVMGPVRFLLFYLACGLVAALTHVVLNPVSAIPVVGASGAISGVMGAYLLLFPRARIRMFTLLIFYPLFFDLPAVVFLIFWFIGQLMSGAASLTQTQAGMEDVGGIAFAAHIGGFIAGMVLMPFFRRGQKRRR